MEGEAFNELFMASQFAVLLKAGSTYIRPSKTLTIYGNLYLVQQFEIVYLSWLVTGAESSRMGLTTGSRRAYFKGN